MAAAKELSADAATAEDGIFTFKQGSFLSADHAFTSLLYSFWQEFNVNLATDHTASK